MCICVSGYVHMKTGAHRGQKVFSDTVDLESVVSTLTGCWEPKLDPLQKQYNIVTTELQEAFI